MWKFLSEAHKKQAQAIIDAKPDVQMKCLIGDSSLKATQMLELKILELGAAFFDWIKSHKAFAKFLKNWLMKFLLQDSNPSSSFSSNLSMPAVLSICSIWSNAIERVSKAGVLHALKSLSRLLHQLGQNLHEERYLRLKMDYLSSYHERKMKKFCRESGVDWGEYASFIQEAESTSAITSEFSSMHARYMSFRPIRIKLSETSSRHEEVIKQVNAAAADFLQSGLQVFETLESLSMEMSNAFEQVNIPNGGMQ